MSEALRGRFLQGFAVGQLCRSQPGRTTVDSPWIVDQTTEEVET
jgi:hypothetical protein